MRTSFNNILHECHTFLSKLIEKDLIIKYNHVGATAVLHDNSEFNDIDFICLVSSFANFHARLKTNEEFTKLNDNMIPDLESDYGDLLPLTSYKLTTKNCILNLIIIESETYYEAFNAATIVQREFNLNIVDKNDRVQFHEIFVKYYYKNHMKQNEIDYFPSITSNVTIVNNDKTSLEEII